MMEIVRMTRAHTAALAELERLCFSRPWSREALEEEIDSPSAVFFVALADGRPIGYAGMHCPAGDGYLDNVAVFPEFRRRGAASLLLRALEEETSRRGGEFLTLEVRASNEGAIALYKGLGFTEEGRRKGFYADPREDALILTKRWNHGKGRKTGMILLGIESSCDETAAAVVEDGRRVLSSVIASQVEEHKLYGGVVPEIASRRHSEAIVGVVREALEQSGKHLSELDGIAVTYAPGLIGALLVGVNFAKGLALSTGLPLVPVHHLRGHIASNYLTNPELEPPFLCLVVSGGHSHIIDVKGYTDLHILGRTRDDAAGEAFDKAARAMGIPYPGGVEMDKIAEGGKEDAYLLPRPRVDGAPLDFSFSGLKTAVINLLHNARQKGETVSIPDLCASYRKAVVRCLVDNFEKAAEQTGARRLVIAGGVSANRLLRRELTALCQRTGRELYMPELKFCGDNAAMIAAQGYYELLAGNVSGMDLNAVPQKPIDEG